MRLKEETVIRDRAEQEGLKTKPAEERRLEKVLNKHFLETKQQQQKSSSREAAAEK